MAQGTSRSTRSQNVHAVKLSRASLGVLDTRCTLFRLKYGINLLGPALLTPPDSRFPGHSTFQFQAVTQLLGRHHAAEGTPKLSRVRQVSSCLNTSFCSAFVSLPLPASTILAKTSYLPSGGTVTLTDV